MESQQVKNWIIYNRIKNPESIIFFIDTIDNYYKKRGIIWEVPEVVLDEELIIISFSIDIHNYQAHFFYKGETGELEDGYSVHEINDCDMMPSTMLCVCTLDGPDYACYMIDKSSFGIIAIYPKDYENI